MIKIMVMIMIMFIIMMIWRNEGTSGAQASRAIPCTSEPKSRAHMGCFPKTQKHQKSTFLHLVLSPKKAGVRSDDLGRQDTIHMKVCGHIYKSFKSRRA